jgi:integrase
MALTSVEVRNAKPGRHADGGGLYLLVRPTGARSWLLRTQNAGKRRDLGLGPFPAVSLAQARAKAIDFKSRILNGEDTPKARPVQTNSTTFEEAARACHNALKAGWRNKHHRLSWLASLENHIFEHIGSVPVDEVSPAMVRDALAPIWLSIPETARRILQRITTVIDYAHILGWCAHEASLRTVPKGLPRQPFDERHYEAMDYSLVPGLVRELQDSPATAGRDALMFTIYNAVRSGETRLARWSEIDWKSGSWTIPAARMKMRKQHLVPLSSAALGVLERRRLLSEGDDALIFSSWGDRPLSQMTLTKVLRDRGQKTITVHGFRSSFTDWAAECTDFRKEVVDKALAHKLPDRVEAAYRRTDFFARRRDLMDAWGQYLSSS